MSSPDTSPVSPLGSPFNELGSLGGLSSQPRLIQPPQSDAQKLSLKFERMETLLKDSGFDSLGEFLKILLYNPSRVFGEPDPRGSCHAKAVSRFLQGRNKIKMADVIPLIYGHKHSAPSSSSPRYSERHAPFSSSGRFLSLKSFMHVLQVVYSLGLPRLSLIMFTVRSTNLVLKITMFIFEHRQMAVAWIV